MHHFGSKAELVVAAVRHLALRRVDEVRRRIENLTAVGDFDAEMLELLWQLHEGPLSAATVELWVAGRTDAQLGAAVRQLDRLVAAVLVGAVWERVSDVSRRKDLRDLVYTAMDVLRGILVASFPEGSPERARRRWERALPYLAGMAASSVISTPESGSGAVSARM